MSADRVGANVVGGVLTITLNRPDKRNAIDQLMIDQLQDHLEQADLDQDTRVVAIRGAGKDFCAGADLSELLASADRSPEENAHSAAKLGAVFERMRDIPKPIVAVVQGRALAGGCGLATACDLVLAHADSTFGYPEIQRGFVPAMVLAMLRRAVGEKVAFDLVATGRLLAAGEAERVGLVSRVVPADGFDAIVNEFLTRVASTSGSALALIKRQVYAMDGLSFRDAIRLGAQVNAVARSTPDFKQAVAKFLER